MGTKKNFPMSPKNRGRTCHLYCLLLNSFLMCLFLQRQTWIFWGKQHGLGQQKNCSLSVRGPTIRFFTDISREFYVLCYTTVYNNKKWRAKPLYIYSSCPNIDNSTNYKSPLLPPPPHHVLKTFFFQGRENKRKMGLV